MVDTDVEFVSYDRQNAHETIPQIISLSRHYLIAHTFLAVHCTFLNNSHLGINLKNNNDKTNKKTKQNKAKTKKKKRQKEKRKLACVAWQLWSVAQTSQCGAKNKTKRLIAG